MADEPDVSDDTGTATNGPVDVAAGPDALPGVIWRQVVQQSPELAVIVDDLGRCWFASLTLEDVTGFTEEQVLGQSLFELVHPEDRARLDDAVTSLASDRTDHPVVSLPVRVCFAELAWHDLSLRARRLDHGQRHWYLLTVRDETVQRQVEAALLRRTELEVLVERIQQRFSNAASDDIDGTLGWALEETGRFLGADRAYVLSYDLTERCESMTHEWHSSLTEPELDGYQGVSFDEVPISMVRTLRGEIVAVTSGESLGDEWAADRAFLEANGIRSLLELPMVRDGLTLGTVGFDWLARDASWTPEDLTILGVLGATFSQLLARNEAEVALERTVADSQMRFAALVDNLPDPVMRVGPDGELLYANPAAERTLLAKEGGRIRLSDRANDAIHDSFRVAFDTNEIQTHTYEVTTPTGVRHLETRVVPEPGPDGRAQSLLLVSADFTDRRREQQDLEYDASHDPLTGLANRALFLSCLQSAADHHADRGMFAVLYLDLDRFKNVNDSFGHAAGDELLLEVSRRLTTALRQGDVVARLGGDEFTVLIPALDDPACAVDCANRLLEAVAEPMEVAGHRLIITGSVGVAIASDDNHDAAELLHRADAAMYHAKETGRARVVKFDRPGPQAPTRRGISSRRRLRLADEKAG
jgi:diguanylate cyclase (GGDEF)-like protein/PAS domain S-box-containing protein